MAAVVRHGLLLVLVVGLAACGGSSSPAAGLGSKPTTEHGTARFTLAVAATVGGSRIVANETGTVSFTDRRAHFYKLVPGGGLPQEIVLSGPFTYANANVDAALNDPSVKPWTKLDTRRLSPQQVREHPDELAHVRAIAYLADGVAKPTRVGAATVDGTKTTRFRATVDPRKVVAGTPRVAGAIRDDYPARPFPADFWVDADGRLRRVLVSYSTPKGTRITLDGGFSDFGTEIDLTVPPAEDIQDITP
ncbi:MAG: LppX_LprAFG lipoprotein [Actinobacteria bacterium]|nr:MAG: LppX_LprAFG lipoprotein [Actinomycetota bacterium]